MVIVSTNTPLSSAAPSSSVVSSSVSTQAVAQPTHQPAVALMPAAQHNKAVAQPTHQPAVALMPAAQYSKAVAQPTHQHAIALLQAQQSIPMPAITPYAAEYLFVSSAPLSTSVNPVCLDFGLPPVHPTAFNTPLTSSQEIQVSTPLPAQFISPSAAQNMLRHLGYVVSPEPSMVLPQRQHGALMPQYTPFQQLPSPQSVFQTPVHQYMPPPTVTPSVTPVPDARAMLANLIMQAAPPSYAPSLAHPAVVNTMMDNLFAAMAGEKAKKPLGLSATTERFAPHIANHPLPEVMVTPLYLGTYDGTTDPEDFLQRFEGAIKTQHWEDAVACHMFPTILQGVAREWFAKLTPQSILSFADLRAKFLAQYHNLKRHALTHLDAHDIRQYGKESLEDFISRFTAECQKIPDLPPSQQVSGFTYGIDPIRHGSLVQRLRRKLPKTFAEAISIARSYLRSGEDRDLTRINRKHEMEGDRHPHRYDNHGKKSESSHQDDNRRHNRQQHRSQPYDKGNLLSSLTKTPKEILATEPSTSSYNPPAPMEQSEAYAKGKYCDFHEEQGHDTNDCRELKKQIIAAIRAGKLDHLFPKQTKKTNAGKTFAWQKKQEKQKAPDAIIR